MSNFEDIVVFENVSRQPRHHLKNDGVNILSCECVVRASGEQIFILGDELQRAF